MFRYYSTYDIISEINIQIIRFELSIQILVDENDLFFLSKSLFNSLDKNIEIEIIIVANSNNKSLKTINLFKRLIDGGVSIYWYNNSDFFNEEQFFGIFDKTFLIFKSSDEKITQNEEEYVRYKNNLFKTIKSESKKIELLSGAITIEFNSEETIVQKNQTTLLTWNVENAYHVSIEPDIGDVPLIGSMEVNLTKDQSFSLTALNKGSTLSKSLFIKVFETKEIEFEISVFDPIIKNFITIEPSSLHKGHYGVYFGQLIKIYWNFNMIGKLHEITLGNLPLVGFHEFKILENTQLAFTLNTLENTQNKALVFHVFENAQIYDKLNPKTPDNNMTVAPVASLNVFSRFNQFLASTFSKIQLK